MSIRLGNSCTNCENLVDGMNCKIHGVQVSDSYTCDSFEMKAALKNDPNCTTCSRYEGPTCANPQKAALGMLCSHWAPQNAIA
ncbi:hypothetical protein ULMS_06300 [Patiriisocius marinistellae]|uniref:Uncharacterized protein n=1 Tax=Patiriisocius marinistellae TaxID=2494560 RepID=A0A5J4FVK6_9FLAO|nr:hypothetical protein [Patiriisocius marinistellae]GEQ85122.1 hypothetical protein ULMS_06300 [Patiriisocius marinistellae]